jgi:hypothetical protein
MLKQSNIFSNFNYSKLSPYAMLAQWYNLIFKPNLKGSNPASATGQNKMEVKCVVESIEYFFPLFNYSNVSTCTTVAQW